MNSAFGTGKKRNLLKVVEILYLSADRMEEMLDPDKTFWDFKHDNGKSIAQYIKRCILLTFCFSDISAGQHIMCT